jgi:putative hydrolase of the HAD superfamily
MAMALPNGHSVAADDVRATILRVAPELFVFDFDGTLAHRPGLWSQCLLDVIDICLPGHGATIDELRLHLRSGFPWHRAEVAHPELNEPDAWWANLNDVIDSAYLAVGVERDALGPLRNAVRTHFCDPSHFELYSDTVPALEAIRSAGLRTVILSNHVPELESIVTGLGLERLVNDIFSSARTGYEKPHPEAFRFALGSTAAERALMIGDNPVADEEGAKAAGMRAVLVRHPHAESSDVITAVTQALADGRT